VHLDPVGVGVHHPVLGDPGVGVEVALEPSVHRRVGHDLDHQRRGALDVGHGHDPRPVLRDEDDVGLDHVGLGKNDVEGRNERLAAPVLAQVCLDGKGKAKGHGLVAGAGRWNHVDLPVDELAAPPVVGEQDVVLVGEFGARPDRHGSIVAVVLRESAPGELSGSLRQGLDGARVVGRPGRSPARKAAGCPGLSGGPDLGRRIRHLDPSRSGGAGPAR